jgi:hypothetical protein
MGTHPSGPAVITGSQTTLKAWVQEHPEALGQAVQQRFGADLPYLFKVRAPPALRPSRTPPYAQSPSARGPPGAAGRLGERGGEGRALHGGGSWCRLGAGPQP